MDGKTEIGTYTTKDEVFFGTTYTHYYLDINDGYVYDAYPEGKLGFWYQYSYQSRMLKTEEEFNAYCYGGVWYGEGTYNPNGTVADGWIFSLENALDILDDYYTALEFGQKAYGSKEAFITAYKAALQNAKALRQPTTAAWKTTNTSPQTINISQTSHPPKNGALPTTESTSSSEFSSK